MRDVSIYTAANRRGWNKIALAVRTGGIALTGDYFGRAPTRSAASRSGEAARGLAAGCRPA